MEIMQYFLMLLFILPPLLLINETHNIVDIHEHVNKFFHTLGVL